MAMRTTRLREDAGLAHRPRELAHLVAGPTKPDAGRGACDLAEHLCRDGVASRRPLERRHVRLGDALEVELRLRVAACARAERIAQARVGRQEVEGGGKRLDLVLACRHTPGSIRGE